MTCHTTRSPRISLPEPCTPGESFKIRADSGSVEIEGAGEIHVLAHGETAVFVVLAVDFGRSEQRIWWERADGL